MREVTLYTGNILRYPEAPDLNDKAAFKKAWSELIRVAENNDKVIRNQTINWQAAVAGSRPLAYIKSINFNTSADQEFLWFNEYRPEKYILDSITVYNPTGSLTTAQGGVYTGASKTGVTCVAPTQVYTALVSSANFLDLTLVGAVVTAVCSNVNLYFSLSTPQGSAVSAAIVMHGRVLE